MRLPRFRRTLVGVLLSLASAVGVAPAEAQDGLGFRFLFGWQETGGDLGARLGGAADAEFSLLVPAGPLRLGGGANWASIGVADEERSWSQIRLHALAGYSLVSIGWIRPYVEARYTFHRLRPEDDRFYGSEEEELLRDFNATGHGWEAVGGVELPLGSTLRLNLSGGWAHFSLDRDLSPEGFGPIDSGRTWRASAGMVWFPTARP
jgi:hypothetical protein